MTSILPEDANGNPIPALRLKANAAHQITTNAASSTRNTAPLSADTDIISIYATEACYINIGNNTVEATINSHYVPAGVYIDLALGPNDQSQNAYISALSAGGNGILYISEKE